MKITVNFDNGTKAIIYGVTPLDFAYAIAKAFNEGEIDFQTKESIEDAVAAYNSTKVLS